MSISLDKEYTPAISVQAVRHNVLRNTYWLLALAMIPSVLGAVVGVTFNIPIPRGFLGFFLFLGVAWGFMYAIEKTKDSAAGIGVLFAFTFFLGVWLTPLLTRTLGFSNGGQLIMLSFGGTAAILATMATIATVSKRDFSMMGKWLSAGVIVLRTSQDCASWICTRETRASILNAGPRSSRRICSIAARSSWMQSFIQSSEAWCITMNSISS